MCTPDGPLHVLVGSIVTKLNRHSMAHPAVPPLLLFSPSMVLDHSLWYLTLGSLTLIHIPVSPSLGAVRDSQQCLDQLLNLSTHWSLSHCSTGRVYLKSLQEICQSKSEPAVLNCKDPQVTKELAISSIRTQQECDNMSAIKLAKNPIFHATRKYLEFCHHFSLHASTQDQSQV